MSSFGSVSSTIPFIRKLAKENAKPGPHQQQCRTTFALKFRLFFRQRRRLHCQHYRSNKQQSCQLLRQCCFDIVANVDRALQRV